MAAMCSEADPLDCHRCLLVGRALAEAGLDVGHILASGEIVATRKTRTGCSNSNISPTTIC